MPGASQLALPEALRFWRNSGSAPDPDWPGGKTARPEDVDFSRLAG
jgi:hypothetical protein